MNTVAIIDYGMCNLDSIRRAVEECGGTPVVTDQERDIKAASYIILPGVGSFSHAMNNLRQRSLDKMLGDQVLNDKIPFLGICLGMQLMATKGLEHGESAGLGWIDGEVRRLVPSGDCSRIPHIGWNEAVFTRESRLFNGIPSGNDFYFVHSYHLYCGNEQEIIARTPYCDGFVSAVERDHIFGVQFHPEKSQRLGFQILRNFLSL